MRAVLALAFLAAGSVVALAADDASSGARFTMSPAPNGGVLRLDRATGAVSLCTVTAAGAECRAASDDRASLNDEITRLRARNAELERRLAESRAAAPPPPVAALPSREDMGKAMDFAEEFMRRMMRVMRDDRPAERDHI